MFARPVSDITWSNESYNTRELMSRYPAPLLVRVTHGHCGLQDSDSLGQGQVRNYWFSIKGAHSDWAIIKKIFFFL